jgi:hypothetical protein
MTYVLVATSEPPARQLTIETTGQIAEPAPMVVAELAGVTYERLGEAACTATTTAGPLAGQREPIAFLTGVIGAEQAGTETVNGVAANRYTFDARALGQADLAQSIGEVWVAADGGYVVRYVLTRTGNAEYFGLGIEGTATWVYDLTDVDQPLAVELPSDCPSGMVDAPLLADAGNVVNVPGLLTFSTLAPLPEAVAFYQEQLSVLGWQQAPDPLLNETTAVIDFVRAGEELLLVVTAGEGGTNIQLALSRM